MHLNRRADDLPTEFVSFERVDAWEDSTEANEGNEARIASSFLSLSSVENLQFLLGRYRTTSNANPFKYSVSGIIGMTG